jgi:hypothetical protein
LGVRNHKIDCAELSERKTCKNKVCLNYVSEMKLQSEVSKKSAFSLFLSTWPPLSKRAVPQTISNLSYFVLPCTTLNWVSRRY